MVDKEQRKEVRLVKPVVVQYKRRRRASKFAAGQRFGRLTVIEPADDASYLCRCDCGNQTKVQISHLKTRRIISCGCVLTKRRV